MKKQILPIVLGLAITTLASTANAAHVSSQSEKGYTVHSRVDGHEVTTAYNKKGKLVYTITRYSFDNLDKNVIDVIKTVYDKYAITGIEKIEQPGLDIVFIAHLENDASFKTVRISNDEVELVQDLVKG